MFALANAPQFTLTIPNVPNDFKVLAFEGTETISALYSISVDLVSEYPDIDLESLLHQPAFLHFCNSAITAKVFTDTSKVCPKVMLVNA